jgi:hypothetical protein
MHISARVFLIAAVPLFGGYTVVPIPAPTGTTIVGLSSINDSGQVVGYVGSVAIGFIGSPSGSVVIPPPPGWSILSLTGLNNSGQITGALFNSNLSLSQVFIGTSSSATAIPVLPGWTYSYGWAVNDNGQVAGSGGISFFSSRQAFVGTSSGVTLIPLPAGWTSSSGNVINRNGQVAGWVKNVTTYGVFVGTTAGSSVIPTPAGWINLNATGINDSGQVVGTGGIGANVQAFFYNGSTSIPIPLPQGAANSYTSGYQSVLNNSGTVVGSSDAGGWIWSSTLGTVLLNTQVPAGWNVLDAYGINNAGVIAAQVTFKGGPLQYVELVPAVPTTPAPSTLTLVVIAASGVAIWAAFRSTRKPI